MKLEDLTTTAQLADFLEGTHAVAFAVISNTISPRRWLASVLTVSTDPAGLQDPRQ